MAGYMGEYLAPRWAETGSKTLRILAFFGRDCGCRESSKTDEWLGWQDSNLRMAIPKTAALPLGYTPTNEVGGKYTSSFEIASVYEGNGFIFLTGWALPQDTPKIPHTVAV